MDDTCYLLLNQGNIKKYIFCSNSKQWVNRMILKIEFDYQKGEKSLSCPSFLSDRT